MQRKKEILSSVGQNQIVLIKRDGKGAAVTIGGSVGRYADLDSQLVAELAAQIQSQTGGVLLFSAVASGKSLFKDSGQFVCRDSDSVIRKGKNGVFPRLRNGKAKLCLLRTVFYRVDNQLI